MSLEGVSLVIITIEIPKEPNRFTTTNLYYVVGSLVKNALLDRHTKHLHQPVAVHLPLRLSRLGILSHQLRMDGKNTSGSRQIS